MPTTAKYSENIPDSLCSTRHRTNHLMYKIEITLFIKEKMNSLDAILKRLHQLVQLYTEENGSADWFLTGKNKEDAMTKLIFHGNDITSDAIQLLTNKLPDFPLAGTRIWSGNDDSIEFENYIQSDIACFQYRMVHYATNEKNALSFTSQIALKIIDKIEPHIFQIETNGYSLHESQVFPDRLPVGWMFYIDKSYDEKTINLPKQMHSIKREGQPVGTLFVTKRDFFDGSNKADITLSNDLEIALVAHDILPTYKKIF